MSKITPEISYNINKIDEKYKISINLRILPIKIIPIPINFIRMIIPKLLSIRHFRIIFLFPSIHLFPISTHSYIIISITVTTIRKLILLSFCFIIIYRYTILSFCVSFYTLITLFIFLF